MENVEIGLMLMGIGMTTVFAILLLVICIGKGLIVLVNKYAPEEIRKTTSAPVASVAETISGATLAAIISAVGITSQGRANVIKVEKM